MAQPISATARLQWAVALITLMRHRPARRLAYYAAMAAVARIALLHASSTLSSVLNEVLARATRRIAAWQYARKYLVHLHEYAIPFDEVTSSPRTESTVGCLLPPISESEPEEPAQAESAVRTHWGARRRCS